MKKEINLYDEDMNFIKTFQSVEECAEFFDKEKNYIHHNLKYRDKIRKDGKWYKIRRIVKDEKQEKIDKAIDKLYCWGEVLDADFQREMLKILKGEKE